MSQAIGTAIVKFVTGAAKVNAIVANVVGTTVLMVGSNLLTPKARFGNVKERDSLNIRGINSRGSTDSRAYIYGQVRVGGTVVYMETTGADNQFLHMVLVHCDHEVDELGDVYVNDVKVVFDSGSEGSLRNAQGTRYSNSLYIADHLGGPSQTVDSTLDAASGKWGSNDKLSGMAYTYIRMELKVGEDNAFPNGIPTFTRVVKGRKVYDPRLDSTQTGISGSGSQRADDSTTWTWSNNWALCVADYITSDFGYGRFGNSWSNINVAELDASADNCDETVNEVFASWSNGETVSVGWRRSVDVYLLEANNDGTTGSTIPDHSGWSVGDTVNDGTVVWTVQLASLSQTTTRYKLDGIVEADEDPLEVVKEMKGAAAGFIEYIGGSWVITSGRYQAPTITLTESDFAGPITGTSKDDRTRAINGVRGVIANQDDAYNVIDAPPISSAAYVTEDNGVESFRDLKLLYTTSTSAAQRLFKIELLRARQSLAFRSTFTASAFRLKAGDTFSLDFDRYGWSGKVFQVWSTQLKTGGDGELVVDVQFRETASNVYSYTAITDETVVDPAPNTNLPDPFEVTAPTGMTAESGTDQLIETSDGSILPTVLVEWTAAASVNVIGYQIRWKYANLVRDAHYRYLTINGRNNTSSVITGVRESRSDANHYIDIDIRSLTPVKEGEFVVVEHDHDVIGKSAAPTAPTGFAATAIVEGVKLSMNEHPDLDFKHFLIFQNTTNSKPASASYITSDTTKTITGLTAGQQYFFFLEAEDTTGHKTAAASGVNATPTATAAGDVTGLGALATENTVDLTTTSNGGVTGVLPTGNTAATDNGDTIDTSGNVTGDITVNATTGVVESANYATSSAGWKIDGDGNAEFNDATIRGDLLAGTIAIGTSYDEFEVASNGNITIGGRLTVADDGSSNVTMTFPGNNFPDNDSVIIQSPGVSSGAAAISMGGGNGYISGTGLAKFEELGVGTLNPSEKLEVVGNAILDTANANLKIKAGVGDQTGAVYFTFNTDDNENYGKLALNWGNRNSDGLLLKSIYPISIDGGNGISFREDGTEYAKFANTGTFMHNFTGTGFFPGLQNDTHGLMSEDQGANGNSLHVSRKGSTAANFARNTNNGTLIGFYSTAAGGTSAASLAGTIEIDSATTVSIQSASDYRLKENIVSVTDAIDRLKQMPVYRFNFIHDKDRVVDGFIAHEVQPHVPEAVKGEKDGMKDEEYMVSPAVYEDVVYPAVKATYDEDGNEVTPAVDEWIESVLVTEAVMDTRTVPKHQTMDQSKLVPLLTAALQEAVAKIEALEARVETIEGCSS